MKRTPSGLNLLVGVDKPCGMTSHDVVNKVRRAVLTYEVAVLPVVKVSF